MILLVVGLGNPGPRYGATRHNAGFMLLDALAPETPWRRWRGLGEYARKQIPGAGSAVWCARPLTFMNDSGDMVADFAAFHRIAPAEILVCFDDVDLPLGRLRLRARGSSGGHRGMESVSRRLGTEEVPRLRVGIGPVPPGRDPAEFVLEPFGEAEAGPAGEAVLRGAQAVQEAVVGGLESAMNKFNR